MKNKDVKNFIFLYGDLIYKISGSILLRKLKNKEKLDSLDFNIMIFILEYFLGDKNEG